MMEYFELKSLDCPQKVGIERLKPNITELFANKVPKFFKFLS